MAGAETEQQQDEEPNLLIDLPGPAFAALWASLKSEDDRLSLFQSCKSVRDRILSSSAQAVSFYSQDDAELTPGSLELLRALFSRSLPLSSFSGHELGEDAAFVSLLREVAAWGLAAAPGGRLAWAGAAGLKELVFEVRMR